MMVNWYVLLNTGSIEYLGAFEDFDAAYDKCPGNAVRIVDEAEAREWLKQLVEMLKCPNT